MPLTTGYAPTAPDVRAADRRAVAQGRHLPILALVALELAVLYAPTVAWLIDRWTISVWHNAHGLFVPPLVGWLAWQELQRRPDLPTESSAWGFVLLVPALLLHALDAGMHTQLLSALGLLIAIPGLSLLFLGRTRSRLIAFPLAFLLFALPIPLAFTEPLHLLLRHIAAAVTAEVLPLFGIAVFLEGTTLHTTSGPIQIADACSGFSTLYAAMAVACLAGHSAGSWRRALLVLVAAPPIAIAANLLRVGVLTLLVIWHGADILQTSLHPLSGMMTFALALPVIFWLSGSHGRGAAR